MGTISHQKGPSMQPQTPTPSIPPMPQPEKGRGRFFVTIAALLLIGWFIIDRVDMQIPSFSDVLDTVRSEISMNDSSPEDVSNVAKEYTLAAGNYTVGIDLPAGKARFEALSGTGNVSSSNMYDGGVNDLFGVSSTASVYKRSFENLALPKDVTLKVSGDVTITLTYEEVTSTYQGREWDESKALTLAEGKYQVGKDFPAGTYKITALSGYGMVISSNGYSGGVSETFGIDTGDSLYTESFTNASLAQDATLNITGEVSVKLTPQK